MLRILITAYGPYDNWPQNASWLTLQAFLRETPPGVEITSRLYPVEFDAVRARLELDLADGYDVVLHLGQAPGAARIELETVGLNVGRDRGTTAEDAFPLTADGPVAYRSLLPLAQWEGMLRAEGIPAAVSYHAGCYLCNAALYLSHYFIERSGGEPMATFLHLPLDPSQVLNDPAGRASLPVEESARALSLIVSDLARRHASAKAQAGLT